MTEREKMINSYLYDPSDEELCLLRTKARQAAIDFNRTNEDEQEKRAGILKDILGAIGEDSYVEPNLRLDYGVNLYIGKDCYINFDCTFCDCAEIRLGDNVLVGPGCSFLTPAHALLAEERNNRLDENGRKYDLEYCRPITVEDYVWFGGNVTVNGGVTIGKGSVIGSGSVVTRDIPPGVVAAGVPCRVIRPITEADRMDGSFYV